MWVGCTDSGQQDMGTSDEGLRWDTVSKRGWQRKTWAPMACLAAHLNDLTPHPAHRPCDAIVHGQLAGDCGQNQAHAVIAANTKERRARGSTLGGWSNFLFPGILDLESPAGGGDRGPAQTAFLAQARAV